MEVQVCRYCGAEKTEDYFYDRPGGLSPICIECEQHIYDRLSENKGVGAYIGLFATCAALNVPFWPDKLPLVKDFLEIEDRWCWYNEAIAEEVHGENGLVRGFFDGETNILHIFGTSLSKTRSRRSMKRPSPERGNSGNGGAWNRLRRGCRGATNSTMSWTGSLKTGAGGIADRSSRRSLPIPSSKSAGGTPLRTF